MSTRKVNSKGMIEFSIKCANTQKTNKEDNSIRIALRVLVLEKKSKNAQTSIIIIVTAAYLTRVDSLMSAHRTCLILSDTISI